MLPRAARVRLRVDESAAPSTSTMCGAQKCAAEEVLERGRRITPFLRLRCAGFSLPRSFAAPLNVLAQLRRHLAEHDLLLRRQVGRFLRIVGEVVELLRRER